MSHFIDYFLNPFLLKWNSTVSNVWAEIKMMLLIPAIFNEGIGVNKVS